MHFQMSTIIWDLCPLTCLSIFLKFYCSKRVLLLTHRLIFTCMLASCMHGLWTHILPFVYLPSNGSCLTLKSRSIILFTMNNLVLLFQNHQFIRHPYMYGIFEPSCLKNVPCLIKPSEVAWIRSFFSSFLMFVEQFWFF